MDLRATLGFARSLAIYLRPGRQRGLRRLYAPFVSPGGLVFDIGAHVGDRSRAFLALGARVVAVEPQPRFAAWLERTLVPRGVAVERLGVDAKPGHSELRVSRAHPTVSTINPDWSESAHGPNSGFARVRWDQRQAIEVTTLDALVARHGLPQFCKIDVEGVEDRVLAGLGQPIPGLSFEFVQGALDVAARCIDTLVVLGNYRFNAVAGERRRFLWSEWRDGASTKSWLAEGADRIASGDLYARWQRGARH